MAISGSGISGWLVCDSCQDIGEGGQMKLLIPLLALFLISCDKKRERADKNAEERHGCYKLVAWCE